MGQKVELSVLIGTSLAHGAVAINPQLSVSLSFSRLQVFFFKYTALDRMGWISQRLFTVRVLVPKKFVSIANVRLNGKFFLILLIMSPESIKWLKVPK